ncbi:peptidoglycan D,D-transpeptidase FtsI family protein [Microbacterium hydrocarbonoxydans]|uniref:peptidoglycan D,D-transpeptidase FtsI family protein n=1 Tax=Microbacterium hydrocarbonoxydans TaxID=273678 RepID=UPI0007BB9618|nr:penicillin-binding protein 2 [Microbacterium hydrocarbonoxydans]GAT73508.1 penicillin-binding protein transpeptidase [Microbacterium sp. HM58-2]
MTTRATRGPRRRTVVALAVILAILAAFIVRLVDIQVVRADAHVSESLVHLGAGTTIPGQRGSIVDANGTILAESKLVYDAQLSPQVIRLLEEDEDNPPKVPWAEASERIAEVIGLDAEKLRADIAAVLADDPDTQYFPLAKGLNTEQFIALRDLRLRYLHFESRETRVYPNGAVAGNLLGFLDGTGTAQAGIEQMESQCLAPVDGQESYRIGKDGVVIPGSERTVDAVDGGTVELTINSDLQWYLTQMISEEAQAQGAQGGTAFVVEVKTGKIRAAAEWPYMDPNDLDSSTPETRKNKIFSYEFEPGSTFKAVTAAAVMEGAGVTPLSPTVSASSHEKFPNGAVINDAFVHPAFNYTLAGALIDSSNVALSKFGTMVSPDVRYDYLQRFGVGDVTVGFPEEYDGSVHPTSEWDNQSLYTTTFGQYFTVTVPQVAGAYQAIANGGEKIDLSLIESCTKADGTVTETAAPEHEQIIEPQTAADLTRMLENVAVQGGNAERIQVPGYRVTSKTGTAQISDGNGNYKSGVYYTSMIGFAPVDDPQYVVMVTLDQPTRVTSSAATASAFQKAMTQVMKTYRVMPSSIPMDALLPKYE